jgi:pilus assembly protein CpaB
LNRNVLIIFGLLMVGVAVVVNYRWQQSVIAENDPGPVVEVLAAKEPLQAGTEITSALLDQKFRLVPIPKKFLYEHYIDRERLARVLGQALRRPLEAGEKVTFFDFDTGDGAAGRLSDTLPTDDPSRSVRAVSVSVDDLSSFGGSLRAGDRIDILATMRHPTNNALVTVSFRDDVEVLAVAASNGAATAVVLALERKDAAMIALLERSAELTFLLRNRSDDRPAEPLGELNLGMLLNVPPDRKPPARIGPIIIRSGGIR